jgi:hypothetical protein
MSICNGTSSSANPQLERRLRLWRRPSEEEEEEEEVLGMDEQTQSSAGLDWAKDEHALCVLEATTGRKILEGRFAHQEGAIN